MSHYRKKSEPNRASCPSAPRFLSSFLLNFWYSPLVKPHWEKRATYPIIFQIGPFTVYSFGALVAAAALTAGWVLRLELKRYRYNPELAPNMVVAAAIAGLIGARLFFIAENWDAFLRTPLDFILTGAGFTWYGGMVGGALAVTWIVRRHSIPWLRAADISAPALALAYGIGRIGCQIAGDGDWGPVSNVPWAMAYPNAIIGWRYPPGVRVHPAPVYEAVQSLVIFAILWQQRKKGHPDGFLFWLYLVLSGLARFAVEFWRINPVIGFGLTEAQWISLVLVMLGNYFLYQQRAEQFTTQNQKVAS